MWFTKKLEAKIKELNDDVEYLEKTLFKNPDNARSQISMWSGKEIFEPSLESRIEILENTMRLILNHLKLVTAHIEEKDVLKPVDNKKKRK